MNRDEQVSRNIELAGRFLDHLLEHPSDLADLPDKANIVLIPGDNEELAEANMKMARRLVRKCPNCGSPLKRKRRQSDAEPESGNVVLHEVCPSSP